VGFALGRLTEVITCFLFKGYFYVLKCSQSRPSLYGLYHYEIPYVDWGAAGSSTRIALTRLNGCDHSVLTVSTAVDINAKA
jgi:hypothetical protein